MLINRKKVRERALLYSVKLRGGRFKRVGRAFMLRLEVKVDELLAAWIHAHPSKGKTLR